VKTTEDLLLSGLKEFSIPTRATMNGPGRAWA